MDIRFEKASLQHQQLIFAWLEEPHMKEFWDNSQEHRNDILNFIHGRKQHYFAGTTKYWVGYSDDQPFCFLLTDELFANEGSLPELYKTHLSMKGHTIALDFGIGNKQFLGKGLAAPTLEAFTKFYQDKIDPKADIFFIDPIEKNPRATRVYEKAGFKQVGSFNPTQGAFIDQTSYLMIKSVGNLASKK